MVGRVTKMMHDKEFIEERTELEDRHALAELFAKKRFRKGAEVGVAQGYNSMMFLENIPGLNLICVDPWNLLRWNEVYPDAVNNLSPYKGATIIRQFSTEAAKLIPDNWLDFVYIDGDHGYQPCLDDINAWAPKVRKGGIVSGHDYIYYHTNVEVVTAVDDYVKEHNCELKLTKWNRHHPLRDERQPSWWFEKE